MNVEGMIWMDRVYVSMGSNSDKNSQIKILKPHAHLCIIGKKSIKFQMNPKKDVEAVDKTRKISDLQSMSAWAITPSKIVHSKILNHMHIFIFLGKKST